MFSILPIFPDSLSPHPKTLPQHVNARVWWDPLAIFLILVFEFGLNKSSAILVGSTIFDDVFPDYAF